MNNYRFECVEFCNRSKVLTCTYACGKVCRIKYSALGLQENIAAAWCDAETGKKTICIRLRSGGIEYIPYDQPLHITNDPSYKAQIQLEYTLLNINTLMRKKRCRLTN